MASMKARILPLAIFALMASAVALAPVEKVWATKSGKKYHKADCKTLARSKTKIEMTLKEAKDKGLKPCKLCHPPE